MLGHIPGVNFLLFAQFKLLVCMLWCGIQIKAPAGTVTLSKRISWCTSRV